ncbi:MAG: ATP-grasp domain-containing protein [Candidatus Pacebacteria bacterium]|nr:ATP-grasp domain-containing protein [Candidatus Paceibacterota bacterium]
MSKIRVGVLRGGTSREYEKSLKSGASVLQNLPEKYIGCDILITKEGTWHLGGIPITPEKLFKKVDVIFNALQGDFLENRHIQHIFESHNIPYTGADSLSSIVTTNKALVKKVLSLHGIKVPYSIQVKKIDHTKEKIREIFRTFPMPAIVKPLSSTYSLGVSLAKTLKELEEGMERAFAYSSTVIIEEYIKGKDAKCLVVEKFRKKKYYAFLPIELKRPKGAEFLDNTIRISGVAEKISPGNFTQKEKEGMEHAAISAHRIVGLRHSSKTDFVVNPRRGVYLLEIDPLQGFDEDSSTSKSLSAVGAKMSHFVDHMIGLALADKKR